MELNFLTISVKDMDRATEFYRKLFQKEPMTETERLVEFEFEGIKIGLHDPETDVTDDGIDFGDNCFPGFKVDDLEEQKQRVKQFTELESEHEIEDHKWISFEDSEGNLLEFYEIT
ncbi:MAG: VOC family protein [Candidatus Nanohalobium sp.]